MSEPIKTFAYIPHRHAAAYRRAGWIVTDMLLPHGVFSQLAEWPFESAPVFPSAQS